MKFWWFTALGFYAGLELAFASEKSLDDFRKPPFFWQTKTLAKKQVFEQRQVVVSAFREDGVWYMKGAGLVSTTAENSFRFACQFERLAQIPKHFSEVKWSPEESKLSMQMQFLGQSRKLVFKITLEDKNLPKKILWQVIEGPFTGAIGELVADDYQQQESLVYITGRYEGHIAWIPNFIFSVGVEAVLQHVATSLRSLIQQNYTAK